MNYPIFKILHKFSFTPSSIVQYNFNNQSYNHSINQLNEQILPLIYSFFKSMSIIISKPLFNIKNKNIKIQICFYSPLILLYLKYLNNQNLKPIIIKSNKIIDKKNKYKTLPTHDNINNLHMNNIKHYTNEKSLSYIKNIYIKIKQLHNLRFINKNSSRFKIYSIKSLIQLRFIKLTYFLINFEKKMKSFTLILSHILNKDIEIECIPLIYPYHNSHILSQLIGLNSKKYTFDRITKLLFERSHIKMNHKNEIYTQDSSSKIFSNVNGIKIKLSGRLLNQKIIPKKTTLLSYKGSILNNANNKIENSVYTNKNKRGAYSIKVEISHKLN